METIARIVPVSGDDFLRAALQLAVDQGWVLVEGGVTVAAAFASGMFDLQR